QDVGTAGSATDEVVPYIAPCDRRQFKDTDESGERSDENVQAWDASSSLRLVPNPTTGLVQVTMPNTTGGTLRVFNASGQNILVTEVTQNTYVANLNLTGFPPGIYLVVLCDESGHYTGTAKISLTH
ncbi:MAG: T9SS C-terminal target domain-containing protein, partial [Haliscomenobacteraceae bacterium CHB4]|nr:T9SS C-terminal target domain-containing protein [Haliscomenobacteraceae bacterium CHB4]